MTDPDSNDNGTLSRFGGRKFVFAVIFVVITIGTSVGLAFAGKVDGGEWVDVLGKVGLVALGYLGANAVQKVGDAVGGKRQGGDGGQS